MAGWSHLELAPFPFRAFYSTVDSNRRLNYEMGTYSMLQQHCQRLSSWSMILFDAVRCSHQQRKINNMSSNQGMWEEKKTCKIKWEALHFPQKQNINFLLNKFYFFEQKTNTQHSCNPTFEWFCSMQYLQSILLWKTTSGSALEIQASIRMQRSRKHKLAV